jgi:hypothetical protein
MRYIIPTNARLRRTHLRGTDTCQNCHVNDKPFQLMTVRGTREIWYSTRNRFALFQRITYNFIPDHWLLFPLWTLLPKSKHNATLRMSGSYGILYDTLPSLPDGSRIYRINASYSLAKLLMAQKRFDTYELSGCATEPCGAGLSSRAIIAGGNSKVIGTSLEGSVEVGDRDTRLVNTEHQSCRITLWFCAESNNVLWKSYLSFF